SGVFLLDVIAGRPPGCPRRNSGLLHYTQVLSRDRRWPYGAATTSLWHGTSASRSRWSDNASELWLELFERAGYTSVTDERLTGTLRRARVPDRAQRTGDCRSPG